MFSVLAWDNLVFEASSCGGQFEDSNGGNPCGDRWSLFLEREQGASLFSDFRLYLVVHGAAIQSRVFLKRRRSRRERSPSLVESWHHRFDVIVPTRLW